LFAGIALNLTPGSDMTFVALSAARGGRRAGLAATAGVFAGCLGHILAAVIGLSALIAASQTAFALVKWLGVAYLIWLAVQLMRQKTFSSGGISQQARFRPAYAFRRAAIINLLNPKVGIFFLAFLPQFVESGALSPWQQILTLGIVFNTTGAIVNSLVALFSAAAARRFATIGWLERASRWFAATVMGSLAVRLAMSRRE
jgi:threonine/homoserine/homoserine lactone efflux protein